jgi:transcription-repair coupling factor (superfamily II helicase)
VNATLFGDRYLPDERERIDVYWRPGQLQTDDQVRAFALEPWERYGRPPRHAQRLLELASLRCHCRRAGVSDLIAGPKGAITAMREQTKRDRRTIEPITARVGPARLKRDGQLVVRALWTDPDTLLAGARKLVRCLTDRKTGASNSRGNLFALTQADAHVLSAGTPADHVPSRHVNAGMNARLGAPAPCIANPYTMLKSC